MPGSQTARKMPIASALPWPTCGPRRSSRRAFRVRCPHASTDSYVKTCQGTKVGDNVDQVYADRIVVASLVNDGIQANDEGRYRDALDVYQSALKTPGGEQLRVLNGIYLANLKMRRMRPAMDAFGKVVDYGLKSDKLAVKFLFKPGSTQFTNDRSIRAPYDNWV